ncbi:site-specific integrase [Citreimonas salinaria]|uniref:Phage integrase family protein n=1 Tax=Citreimonas salinaria TaxID=321339 RepID=A0A1H3LLK6_9RHOB|nr:site-specific integrase [Citreimonas salinaria]SDY65253.1 Phage integrase family protein [Citreimonas salinaria]
MSQSLPKVAGTQQRGTTYHFNVPIPVEIRPLYGDKAAFRGTMKTADPKVAEAKVRRQRTIFDQQVADKVRKEDLKRLQDLLTGDQRAALEAIGGAEELAPHIAELRKMAAFLTAGMGAEEAEDPIQQRAQLASDRAYRDSVVTEVRGAKRIASALNVKLPDPVKGIDEGVMGLQDVAERFLDGKAYTLKNREKVLYTLRRWTELHGDIALDKIKREHLNQFDEALKSLPPALGEHRRLSIHDSIRKARKDNKDPISHKSRETYIFHMKALTAYAVDTLGVMSADPFVGYKTSKPKVRASERKKLSRRPYSPEQISKIINYTRTTFDRETCDHWIPLVAAYTGARQEEIGQLLVEDVVMVGNHQCIRITDLDPEQKVKNYHSLRTIPIPDVLVRTGFLEHVEERRKAGGRMLWLENYTNKRKRTTLQEVKTDEYGRFMTNYGQRFERKVREPLGLTEDGMTFHSLRHSWADAARRAKIDPEIRRMIAGRLEDADPTEAEYGGDDLLAEKLEALNAVAEFVAA